MGGVAIRQAKRRDREAILAFIDSHWRRNHAFVVRPDLFDWQHASLEDPEQLTFVLACRGDDHSGANIFGLLGFVPYSRFDPSADWTELFLAIWKVRDDVGMPGLGLQLLNWVWRSRRPVLMAAIGISDAVEPIYRTLGYTVGAMNHHVLFAPGRNRYSVALRVPPTPGAAVTPNVRLLPVTDTMRKVVDTLGIQVLPRKSWNYLVNRFIAHPYYSYTLRAVEVGGAVRTILVWRCVEVPDVRPRAAVLRLVDIIGDSSALGLCSAGLQTAIREANAEYLDVYHYGIPPESLARGGFIDRHATAGLVVPNYFEPFDRRSVEIKFAFRRGPDAGDRPVRVLRADSDQDRPNLFASTA